MAEHREAPPSKDCNSPIAQALNRNCESVLPHNDQAIVSDKEFSAHRGKLINRSKLMFWWRSISRIAETISGPFLMAGMGMIIAGITAGALNWPILGVIFGTSAVCLGVSIATDYFVNVLGQNQSFDRGDLDGKRNATHLARALDEVSKESEQPSSRKSNLADKLRPQASAASWEEKIRVNPQSMSQSIN